MGRLGAVCLLGWAATTNYTNHAAVIPLLMERLSFGPTQAGLLSTAFFVTLGLVSVPAGVLSDRLGPKAVGTSGLLMVFASNLALGYARHFPDLLLIKLVGGAGCAAAFMAGMRYAALAVPGARVHRALGLYGGFAQFGAGTSLYLIPLLSSFLGWRHAFIASSGVVAAVAVVWAALAPDVRVQFRVSPFGQAMRSRNVWILALVHTATFGLSVLVGIWVTTFLVHDLGLSLVSAGSAGSAILALGVISRPVGGFVVDRDLLGAASVMKVAVLIGTIGLLLLAYPRRPVVAAAVALVALGFVLNAPYSAVMNTTSVSLPRAPGAAVGIVSAVSLLLVSAGAPVLGAAFAWTGSFSLPFGSLALFSLLILWALFRL